MMEWIVEKAIGLSNTCFDTVNLQIEDNLGEPAPRLKRLYGDRAPEHKATTCAIMDKISIYKICFENK